MKESPAIRTAAALVALAAAAAALVSATEFPPRIDHHAHQAVGQALGQEAVRLVKPGGSVVAIRRDSSAFRHPESDAQFEGFAKALASAGVPLASVQALQIDPLRPLAVPPGDFYELIRKGSAGSVIVSFMGPPDLNPEQRARLTEIKPAIVAFCPGLLPKRVHLRELFEAGLLHAAMIDRSSLLPGTVAPKDSTAATYQIVHAADAANLVTPADPDR